MGLLPRRAGPVGTPGLVIAAATAAAAAVLAAAWWSRGRPRVRRRRRLRERQRMIEHFRKHLPPRPDGKRHGPPKG